MEKIAFDVVVGVFSGLVTSLIESYSETLSREAGEALSQYQASRSISQKLSDKISGTCRKLPPQDCDLIAQFLGDEVTVSALTQLVNDGSFDAEYIQAILQANAAFKKISGPALLALSTTVQNTFDECIAEEEFASHYSMLRQIRQVRTQTSEVQASTGRIENTLQDTVVPQIETMATLAALGGSTLSFDSVSFMVTFIHGQLHVRPLSGRMTRSEVATILRTNKDGVSHLVKRKLLKPLGSQKKRKQLFFSSLWLFDQMSDVKWLSKITDELCLFSENKNGREDETAENSIGSQT